MKKYTLQGFSLIELMIVIAIIAFLASVAIPSYRSYVLKSQRTIAITNLLKLQNSYEASYSQNNQYPAAPTFMPANTTYYNYTSALSGSGYILTATANGPQANDNESGTSCSPLTLNNSNVMAPAVCWPH